MKVHVKSCALDIAKAVFFDLPIMIFQAIFINAPLVLALPFMQLALNFRSAFRNNRIYEPPNAQWTSYAPTVTGTKTAASPGSFVRIEKSESQNREDRRRRNKQGD